MMRKKIAELKKKIQTSPEVAFQFCELLDQVEILKDVTYIAGNENLSPYEKAKDILKYLDIPQDKVVDEWLDID